MLRRKKTGCQAEQKNSANYQSVRTGEAQRKSPRDVGTGWLHLQFGERFLSSQRRGNCAHTLTRSTAGIPESSGQISSSKRLQAIAVQRSRIFYGTSCCFLFHSRTALHFLVKKNFLSRLKIKFIFFLSVSKLISSLKPAGEQPQSACE